MKKSVMEKWVNALRSKKYKQGRAALKSRTKNGETRHCCLGVLCELYQREQRAKDKPILRNKTEKQVTMALGLADRPVGVAAVVGFKDNTHGDVEFGVLPAPVRKWAGMHDNCGLMHDGRTLAELNDDGVKFESIANLIEEYYEEL